MSAPPESFFAIVRDRDRDAARKFYKKYLEVDGMPVVAAAEVADLALTRTREIVNRMLAGRPDIVQAMVKARMYLIVIGKDQVYTDMPEYRNHPNPAYQNERMRGTGGKPTSFGEENVLSLPLDRYDDESIAVHEFSHTIDGTLRRSTRSGAAGSTPSSRTRLPAAATRTLTPREIPAEYWAEIVQSYFDCNRVNNWNHGPDRHARAAQGLRSRRLRTGASDLQPRPGTGLAIHLVAQAAQRRTAAVRSWESIPSTPSSPGLASSRCIGRGASDTGTLESQRHGPEALCVSSRHPQGAHLRRGQARGTGPR